MAQVADFTFGKYRLVWQKKASGLVEATAKFHDGSGVARLGLGVFGRENKEAAIPALIAFATEREAKEKRSRGMTCQEVWNAFYAEREADGKMMVNFGTNWQRLSPYFAAMDIRNITVDACQKYAVAKEQEGYAPWSIYSDLARLRALVAFAVKDKWITAQEAPRVWKPQEPEGSVEKAMDLDQVVRLLEATPTEHMRLFIILGIATAGRLTALLELTWDRVNFDTNQIDLRTPAKKKSILDKSFQKGRAVVSMNETVRTALLQAWQSRSGDGAHVIQWKGAPIKSVKTAFRRAVERAGLPDWVTPHILRHSTATIMSDGGVPVEQIAKFLGHSTPKITSKIYIKKSGKALSGVASHVDLPRKLRIVGEQ